MTAQEIIEGCLRGSGKAQKALYQLYAGRLFAVCLRFTGNQKDAEDALQEGFVKIFKSIDRFNSADYPAILPWMRRIMVNTLLNFLRDHRRLRNMEELNFRTEIEDDASEETDFVEEVFSRISPDEIFQMIQDLPDGYRTVFNLYAFEDFSHQEIAEHLGISESTSKTQLMKARKKIAGQIIEKIKRETAKTG